VVIGFGALPEHDFEAGLGALGDLLAKAAPGTAAQPAPPSVLERSTRYARGAA
jgi:hypothetical protein